MNSDDAVSVSYVFQPMLSPSGSIVAVECLSRMTNKKTSLYISPFEFFKTATFEMKKNIFHEQIELIKCNANWFIDNNVIVTINIDQSILMYLLNVGKMFTRCPYDFIHFEICETANFLQGKFPVINVDKTELTFWLDDFGAGYANYSSIMNHHFKYIKIDKVMFWSLFNKLNGKKLLATMLSFFQDNGYKVIVEGVENHEHKAFLDSTPYFALQGYLWPECTIATLTRSGVRHSLDLTHVMWTQP